MFLFFQKIFCLHHHLVGDASLPLNRYFSNTQKNKLTQSQQTLGIQQLFPPLPTIQKILSLHQKGMPLEELVVHQVIPVTVHCTGLHLHLRITGILATTSQKVQKFLKQSFVRRFSRSQVTSFLIICMYQLSIFKQTFGLQNF